MGIHERSGDIGHFYFFSLQHLLWTVLQVFMVSHRTCRLSPPEAVLIHKFPPSRAPARLTQAAGAWKKNHGNNAAAQNGGSRCTLLFFWEEMRGAGAWGSMLPWNRIEIKTTSSEHNGQSWMLPHSYLSGNVKIQPNDFNSLQTSGARNLFFEGDLHLSM